MKILMAASECAPFCKTGGLADVVGALPQALARQKNQVCLVLPKYKDVDAVRFKLRKTRWALRIPVGDSIEMAPVWEGKLGAEVTVYFIENSKYFHRSGLYSGPDGRDFPDNDERFIFFSRAILEVAKAVDFQPRIVHCHDWQTGLVPAYLGTLYNTDAFFLSTASVFTIHNMAYQGIFPKSSLFLAGLSWRDFTPDRLEYYQQVNFLKSGLVYATLLNTVSPTYAREICQAPEFGCGLEGILRRRRPELFGILNGLDTNEWNPSHDPRLPKTFSVKDISGKHLCKAVLQKELGLHQNHDAPLAAVVSRLDPQKGLDLVAEAAEELLGWGMQIVMLGNGDPILWKTLQETGERHPRQFAARTGFEETLAHKIYAGCDLFLMPSRFEPCGLGQMIAMRYGGIPVVTPRGGLADTVQPYASGNNIGTGFVLSEPSAPALKAALKTALEVFQDKKQWTRLVRRAMSKDFSWAHSLQNYLALYDRALQNQQ